MNLKHVLCQVQANSNDLHDDPPSLQSTSEIRPGRGAGSIPLAPPWQELSEFCSIGRVRSCVRPVCAAVKPLAIMLCADRVPIRSTHSRSPDRPCLHYLVCPRQFLQLQTPPSLPVSPP